MAYNAYASIGPPPLPGAGQADGQSMYAPNQGHWLFKAGANDESDMSWEQIERTRARLLENIVKVIFTRLQNHSHFLATTPACIGALGITKYIRTPFWVFH